MATATTRTKRVSSTKQQTNGAYAEVVLQDGQRFQVTENFATVIRHQREALIEEKSLMDLMSPNGTRIAVDPMEIISVVEIQRPTRRPANGKPKAEKKPAKQKVASEPKRGTGRSRAAARRTGRRRQRTTA